MSAATASAISKTSERLLMVISGGLFKILGVFRGDRSIWAAQDSPVDIRAQVFAAHGAISSALDGRTALCRHTANTYLPLTDQSRRDAYTPSQGSRVFEFCGVLLQVHAPMVANRYSLCNSELRV